jgi:hypothetical protein
MQAKIEGRIERVWERKEGGKKQGKRLESGMNWGVKARFLCCLAAQVLPFGNKNCYY